MLKSRDQTLDMAEIQSMNAKSSSLKSDREESKETAQGNLFVLDVEQGVTTSAAEII